MSLLAGVDRRDVALTAVVVVLGQVDAIAPGLYGTNVVGPRWAVSVTYLVAGLAVLVRRTRPGLAFAVGIGALAVQALTVGTSEGNGSLLPAVLLSYSVAVHGSRRVAVAALCAIPVAAAIRELNNPENTTVAEVLNGLGWDMVIVAAWLLGAYVRTRRQLVVELRQRAADSAEAAAVAERARVARELHDVLAHSLGVVVVQAEAAEEALGTPPGAGRRVAAVDPAHRPRGAGRGTPAGRRAARGRGGAGAVPRGRRRGRARQAGQRRRAAGRARRAMARSRGCPPRPTWRSTGSCRSRSPTCSSTPGPRGPGCTSTARPDRVSVEVTDDGRGAAADGRRLGQRPARDAGAGHRARRHLLRRTRATTAASPYARSSCSGSRREPRPGAARRRPGAGPRRLRHDPGPAGRPRGGRLRRGRGRRRLGRPLARAGRGADGRADAGDGRHRGDPADRRRVAGAAPGAGAHHLRPRRVRLRGAPGRGQRVPPQGHAARQPHRGGPGGGGRRRAPLAGGHPTAGRAVRPASGGRLRGGDLGWVEPARARRRRAHRPRAVERRDRGGARGQRGHREVPRRARPDQDRAAGPGAGGGPRLRDRAGRTGGRT